MLSQQILTQELSRLSAAFSKKLTAEQFAVYGDALKQFDDNLLKTAVALCILNCKYFPTVAEIVSNYKIIKDDFMRDNPVQVTQIQEPDFIIDGKKMPEVCQKLRAEFEAGIITKDQFKHELIELERKVFKDGKYAPGEFNRCVQRIEDILK